MAHMPMGYFFEKCLELFSAFLTGGGGGAVLFYHVFGLIVIIPKNI